MWIWSQNGANKAILNCSCNNYVTLNRILVNIDTTYDQIKENYMGDAYDT
jgi:hypothetical protein